MAKKHSIRKKASLADKAQHDSEILQAKRAVCAALTEEGSAEPAAITKSLRTIEISQPSQEPSLDVSIESEQRADGSSSPQRTTHGISGVMKGLVRVAAGLVGRGTGEAVDEPPAVIQMSSTISCLKDASHNPLTDLARRHAFGPGKSPANSADRTDDIGRQVLANLAKTRLGTALESSSQQH